MIIYAKQLGLVEIDDDAWDEIKTIKTEPFTDRRLRFDYTDATYICPTASEFNVSEFIQRVYRDKPPRYVITHRGRITKDGITDATSVLNRTKSEAGVHAILGANDAMLGTKGTDLAIGISFVGSRRDIPKKIGFLLESDGTHRRTTIVAHGGKWRIPRLPLRKLPEKLLF